MWVQMIMAATNIVAGKGMAQAKKTLADAQYKFDMSRADNKFMQNAAGNLMKASQADVDRANQARQNKQAMRQLESGLDQESFNYGKAVDGLNSDRFSQRMQGAEALGSLVASAGAAGVGGASIEQVAATERFRQEVQDTAMQQGIKDTTYASALNKTSIMDNQYNQIDTSPILAGFDYSARDFVMKDNQAGKYGLSNMLSDGMNGFSGNMNNVGVQLDKSQVQGAQAYANKGIDMFKGMFSGGGGNKGLGGGAAIAKTRV